MAKLKKSHYCFITIIGDTFQKIVERGAMALPPQYRARNVVAFRDTRQILPYSVCQAKKFLIK